MNRRSRGVEEVAVAHADTKPTRERRARFAQIKDAVVAVVIYLDEERHPVPNQALAEAMVVLGSGFLVSEDGWIATNHHVVRGIAEAYIRHLAGEGPRPPMLRIAFNSHARPDTPEIYDNLVLAVNHTIHDVAYDISLLKVTIPRECGMPIRPLAISRTRCEEGDLVLTCGFPLGLELQADQLNGCVINASFSKGMVSASNDPRGGTSRFSLDMIVNRGNSGGPICLANTGVVVGVAEERSYRPVNAILYQMGLDLPPHRADRIGVPIGRGRGIHVDCLQELRLILSSSQELQSPSQLFQPFDFLRRHPIPQPREGLSPPR